jgi:hypothetical protein
MVERFEQIVAAFYGFVRAFDDVLGKDLNDDNIVEQICPKRVLVR